MIQKLNGTINGKHIELEHEPGLPAGTRVRVDIDPAPVSLEEFRRRIDEACGAWADDDSIDAIFQEILESRHHSRPRDVNFDVSS